MADTNFKVLIYIMLRLENNSWSNAVLLPCGYANGLTICTSTFTLPCYFLTTFMLLLRDLLKLLLVKYFVARADSKPPKCHSLAVNQTDKSVLKFTGFYILITQPVFICYSSSEQLACLVTGLKLWNSLSSSLQSSNP